MDVLGMRVASHVDGPRVEHINREMLHHGAEIALLRDLYLWRYGGTIMSEA